jgi:tetratricopeptide (TPR) repeat protein
LTLDPGSALAHFNLGLEWSKRGLFDQTLDEFKQAARMDPAVEGLQPAVVSAKRGKAIQTIARYREALRSTPDETAVLNNLAWILATCPEAEMRNGAEAVSLAGRACESTGFKEPLLIGTLAAAYAEAGRFDLAVTTAAKACDLAAALGRTELADRNRELLQQYEKKQAYHEQAW